MILGSKDGKHDGGHLPLVLGFRNGGLNYDVGGVVAVPYDGALDLGMGKYNIPEVDRFPLGGLDPSTDVPSSQPSAIPLGKGYGAITASYVNRFCLRCLFSEPALLWRSRRPRCKHEASGQFPTSLGNVVELLRLNREPRANDRLTPPDYMRRVDARRAEMVPPGTCRPKGE
jgi:hypothetical protein